MNQNPVIRSKQFGSFLSLLFFAGLIWLVNWSGGMRDFLRRAAVRAPRDTDGTSSATPQLILLQGGKS